MIGEKIRLSISAPRKKRYFLFLLAGVLAIFLVLAKFLFFSSPEKPQPVKIQQVSPLPREKVVTGKIAKGDSIFSALRAQNLPADLVDTICRRLKPVVNLRRVKPGDTFEVHLSPAGNFLDFSYQASPVDVYQITVTPSGEWLAEKKEIPVEKYWTCVSGKISTSLFEAMDQLGEQDQLVFDFADIFSWEIDFNSEPQPGDRFQMVVEKYYVGNTFVRYGRILYAEYETASRLIQGIYFQPLWGRGEYYTPQGRSLRKALLRSPLQFTRISSRYSRSRYHPILGGYRPHLGVDYAAPVGSPVWAIADGTVVFCGWNGGYGKQIILRHANGYKSMYAHLGRFAPGIKRGKPVSQKQIIGYVGLTGLTTGPHLDFRLLKNNLFRNPLRELSPPSPPLRPDQMAEFKRATDPVICWAQTSSHPQSQKIASLSSRNLEFAK
jgi:murein DD-endopeptidase MepM/ murein hydrolase activator NlpD